MGSLVPASGAGGLAQKAWVLHRGGIDGQRIAPRSVAFFLIKSGVNFWLSPCLERPSQSACSGRSCRFG